MKRGRITMKVRDLIEELKDVDPDREVIMAKDSEGNGHSPLDSMWEGAYKAETTWFGEVGLETLTEEDRKQGFCELDVLKEGIKALILVPTN